MAKEYVPIFFDWTENTQDLTPEEKGNLIDAVVLYAQGQEYEHLLTGGTKIAFRFMKGQVDRNTAISDARAKAGANKQKQNETNDNKPEQKETNSPKEKEEEKEKENKKDNKKELLARLDEKFDRFWSAYPRKTAKPDAHRAFVKLNPDEALLQTMLNAIERQKQTSQWQEANGQYIPYPASWLRQTRWEDEVPQGKVSPIKPVVAQDYEQREYTETVYTSPEDMIKRLNEEMGITG